MCETRQLDNPNETRPLICAPMGSAAREVWTALPRRADEVSRMSLKAQLFDVIMQRHPNILNDIFKEVSDEHQ